MKTVMTNDMVLHVWAHQTQEHARTANGNLHFDGPVLYSYRTPIANIVDGVALVTVERYSITTSGKHMPGGRELHGVRAWFYVPNIGANGGRHFEAFAGDTLGERWAARHAANLEYMVKAYDTALATYRRARDAWPRDAMTLAEMLEERHAKDARRYAAMFGLPMPIFNTLADAQSAMDYRAEREARLNTPQAIAKRERAARHRAERKAEKERLAALSGTERLEAWRAGAPVTPPHSHNLTLERGAYLRVRGNVLETSQGASVPIDHAVKAFRFIKLVRERGQPWERNGHTLRVGHFQVDRIAANGDFHAGCHFIQWCEVERIATQLGMLDATASDSGLTVSHHAA